MKSHKVSVLVLAAIFSSTSAFAQNSSQNDSSSSASAMDRLTKVLQNNPTYGKCLLEAKVGTVQMGDATYGRTPSRTIDLKITIPENQGNHTVKEIRITAATATLLWGDIYSPRIKKTLKSVASELIDATVLNSAYRLSPNRIILEHLGDGGILSLEYLEAQGSLNGKPPTYQSGLMERCFQ